MKPVERRLLRELPVLRRHMTYSTVLALSAAGLVVAQASLLAAILADGFAGAGLRPAPLVALGAVMALRALLTWVRGMLGQRAAAEAKRALRDRLTARLGQGEPLRLSARHHGESATLLTRGLDALDPYVVGQLPAKAAASIVPLVVVGWLWWTDWTSGLIVLVTLPLIPVFGALVGLHTAQRTARQWQLLARLGGHFLDVVTGLPTLRAFGREGHQVRVVAEMADAHRRATMRTLRVAFLSSFVLETVATLSVALVAVPVGLRLLGGEVDLRTALTVLLLAPEAYLPLRAVGAAFHDSAEGVVVAERVFAVLDEEPGVRGEHRSGGTAVRVMSESGGTSRTVPGAASCEVLGATSREVLGAASREVLGATSREVLGAASREVLGATSREMLGATSREVLGAAASREVLGATSREVLGTASREVLGTASREVLGTASPEVLCAAPREVLGATSREVLGTAFGAARAAPSMALRDVTVRYPGRAAPALHRVSLAVRPGEHLALVGPSGAGKSSLLSLLLGFVAPASGRVEVDGTDLGHLDPDAWRARVAWVPQRPHLFAESVADNIRLGRPDATDAEVREAARAASADLFIGELPRGYDTLLGEHGAGLSAGQRQRVALARAFLKDAPVLLLDEPTAHLDPESEAAVTRATVALMRGRTAVVVAHRTSLLAHADRVVTVRAGALDAEGGSRGGPVRAVR